jgi:hypothetical protein
MRYVFHGLITDAIKSKKINSKIQAKQNTLMIDKLSSIDQRLKKLNTDSLPRPTYSQ